MILVTREPSPDVVIDRDHPDFGRLRLFPAFMGGAQEIGAFRVNPGQNWYERWILDTQDGHSCIRRNCSGEIVTEKVYADFCLRDRMTGAVVYHTPDWRQP